MFPRPAGHPQDVRASPAPASRGGCPSGVARAAGGRFKSGQGIGAVRDTPPRCPALFLRLSCRPAGKLKVSIKASWLRGAKVDLEALTEASFATHKSGEAALAGLAEDEQVRRLCSCPVSGARL